MAIGIGEITNEVEVTGPAPAPSGGAAAASLVATARQPSLMDRERFRMMVEATARDAARTAVEDRRRGEVHGA